LTASAALPLPSLLGGAVLSLTDGSGGLFSAPLLFASPSQINFLVPPGLKSGPGTLSINIGGTTGALPVRIASTHPGLFSANGSGTGPAVGNVLHVSPNGDTIYTPLATCSGALVGCASVPIRFSVPGERIYLVLYGTGIRNVASLSAVSVTIGTQKANVLYAGAQGTFQGLDQVNVEIPRSLSGTGMNQVLLQANGEAANPLAIDIE
jgi:uncharacterized protein (TIGR03437 family)